MKASRPANRAAKLALAAAVCLMVAGCGGSGMYGGPPGTLNVSLSSSIAVTPQNGAPTSIGVTVTGNSGPVTLSMSGMPSGTVANIAQAAGGTSGNITLSSSASTVAGTYAVQVTALSGTVSASKTLILVVAVSAMVSGSVDTSLGLNGKLQQFMSTSFQPADWDWQFFQLHPDTTPLNSLGPQHIRIQAVDGAVPMKANTGVPSDWDFKELDAIVQPVLGVADHSPVFQIAVAPSFMNDAQGHLDLATHLNDFIQYSANLVRYYNAGGFSVQGTLFKSPSPNKITWWGIFNEYNINGLTPSQYVQLYNAVVPAMLQVDPTVKFSALELADFDFGTGDPRNNLPTFVAAKTQGGVSVQVDVASTHFYSSCNQLDPDRQVFNTVPGFARDVSYFYQELKLRADLANVPVWVTENNVNADFDAGNGMSACNPTQKFVPDARGTSPFFAAWRPYVFSQLGKAGNQALYHWDYGADKQYGEVDYSTGNKNLSYWVDFTLGQIFAINPTPPDILALTITETSSVEVLATKNSDGSVVVMVVNRAVHTATDNNGAGDPRTVIVDISALGNFTSASTVTIDSKTDLLAGPSRAPISVALQITITLNGYGVTFLTLKP
jgi:hypothetical protein